MEETEEEIVTTYTFGAADEWITAVSQSSEDYVLWGDTGIDDNLNMTISFWIKPKALYGNGDGNPYQNSKTWANLIHLTDGTGEYAPFFSRSPAIYIGSEIDGANYILKSFVSQNNTGLENNTDTPVFLTFVCYTSTDDTSSSPAATHTYYVNGISIENVIVNSNERVTNAAKLYIGSDFFDDNWNGQLGEPAEIRNMTFYNKVYDDTDVLDLYNTEHSKL
jgi:hypothetical protein